jgi:hypothetical protein
VVAGAQGPTEDFSFAVNVFFRLTSSGLILPSNFRMCAMKIYHSIQQLLGELEHLSWDSAIFIDHRAWVANPLQAEILFLEGDGELEDVEPGTHLPKIAKARNMRQLFDMETFKDIVDFERKRNSVASVLDIIFAINFYREKDVFFNP